MGATSTPFRTITTSPHVSYLSGLCGVLAVAFLWACEDEVMAPPLVPAPSADRAVAAVAATDREALVAFYNATDGSNWERSDNWLTDAALAEWYGVVADSQGQVRWLRLSDNGLKGPIVPELGSLSALEFLGLGENELTGEVPAELADATRLTGIWINDNRLTGIIPSTFLTLSQLRVIDFGGNDGLCIPSTARFSAWTDSVSQVSGPTCSEADAEVLRVLYEATGGGLGNWTNSGGWLSDAVLSEWHGVEIDSVGRVSGLDLSANGLSGPLPDSLVELSVLVSLDLSDNTLSGALPDSLGKLSALRRLDVSGNSDMLGRLPESLTALELDELRYSDTRLCVPDDAEFQEWLDGIGQHEGSGRVCPPTSQYDILAAIYEATNGPKWENNDNWLTEAPLREWYGVGTNSDGQVTSLDLRWSFLQGQIPPEIGGLSSLRYLRLGGSYALTGPLPEELYDLPELRTLALGAFNLGGVLPPEIARLTQLETLDLWRAGLGGTIPVEITQLTNLRRLDLSYNDLLGSIPPEFDKLTELERLDLGYNELSGGIPAELGDLAHLRELQLDNNRLDGAIPGELAKLMSLRTLSLHNNDLEGAIPAEFAALTELESLWLALNPRLSGPLPNSLAALDALESLRAGGTGLCAPEDEEFLTWLNEVEFHRVARCELGATVYLTQPVQSLKFPVPLVAGRSALLRAFVFSPHSAGQPMPDLRATFYRNEAQVHAVDIDGGSAIPAELDESSLAHSANADIPGDVLQPGLEVVIEVDPDGSSIPPLGIAQRMPATGRLAVDVREMPDFQLTLVPFLYEPEPDSSILEITAGMASDPEGHPMFKDTRALLPIGDFDVALHDPVVTSTNNGFQLLRDTEAIRLMEGRPGYWLAMLAPAPRGGLLGVADGIGSWTSFSIPLSRTIAHEFGHNMNLRHAPCGGAGGPDPLFPDRNGRIGAWGYDRVSGQLLSPYATDLMSYCRGGWISGYHVSNSLIHRLDAETEATEAKTRSVIVWGGRDADGQLFLEPAFVVDAIPKLPPTGGEFQLRGRTDAGGEAFSFSFDMPYIPDVEDERSSFVFAVPVTWTDALTSVSLAGGSASVVLDQASYSPMTIVRDPATGQVRAMLRESETAAMDAFGPSEAQRFEVLFSPGIPEVPERRR